MLADPLVLVSDWSTITAAGGETFSFPTIERNGGQSLYRQPADADGTILSCSVGHQFGRRQRFTLRVTADGLTPDLLIDNNNSKFSQSCYVVFDCPSTGPVTTPTYDTSGFLLWNYMLKLVGGSLVSVGAADPLFQRVIQGET